MMVEFCFHNWDGLQAIVEKSWKEDFISFQTKDTMAGVAGCAQMRKEFGSRMTSLRQLGVRP